MPEPQDINTMGTQVDGVFEQSNEPNEAIQKAFQTQFPVKPDPTPYAATPSLDSMLFPK